MRDTWDKTASTLGIRWHDVPSAFAMLTRLPIPVDHAKAGHRAADAAWAYPLVGGVVGLMAGIVGWLLAALAVPPAMAAAAALATLVMLTGGLHEDGLADCADGFGGGDSVDRRLEIMKDSRVGAFGVLALVLAGLARWGGVEALVDAGAIWTFAAVGAVSRLPMVLTMFAMPLARPNGLAAQVGLVGPVTAGVAAAVTVVLALLFAGWGGLLMLIVACLAAAVVCVWAWQRIEGYTGDVLGAVQQIAEVAALAVAAALM